MSPTLSGALQARFDAAMAALGPFEEKPFIAVAVSGGTDSFALLLLSQAWAAERGGDVLALTVDHGTRVEAAAEAATLAAWCCHHAIEHETLRWDGPKPYGNLQAAAREARYALLQARCAKRGCLHLLTGHQADDVAETFLLRLGRGSGLFGLSAMPSEAPLGPVRLLRPLLRFGRAELAASLPPGLPLVADPSNQTDRFARTGIRKLTPHLDDAGIPSWRVAGAAADLARARAAVDLSVARLALKAVFLHTAGFVWLDTPALQESAEEVRFRLFGELLAAVSGSIYPPRFTSLKSLLDSVSAVPYRHVRRTLAGCRVLRTSGNATLICREFGACAKPVFLDRPTLWDGRIQVEPPLLGKTAEDMPTCGPLGSDRPHGMQVAGLPAAVLPSLPAVRDRHGLLAVPFLRWWRTPDAENRFGMRWKPTRFVSGIGAATRYTVV